jgi:hypothetical protein
MSKLTNQNDMMGENPLKCTTQDEKGLILTTVLFYPYFDPHKKIMKQKLSKFSKGIYFKQLHL